MRIEITRKFRKQVDDCKDQKVKSKISSIIKEVIDSENPTQIKNIKKLTRYKNFYRIRIGSYRIGLMIENNTVTFAAFDHRSNIYKYFP